MTRQPGGSASATCSRSSTSSTIAEVGSIRISACTAANDCGPAAAVAVGCSATNRSVTPGAASEHGQREARVDQMSRHRAAHVAEADETDLGDGHCAALAAACASASIAAKTSAALRNASSAAGPPQ